MRRPRRLWLIGAVAAVAVAVDQLLKSLVLRTLEPGVPVPVAGDLVQLSLRLNRGAAFSMGESATWLFALLAIAVAVFVIWWGTGVASRGWRCAAGLFLGGVLGNLADRLFREPGFLHGAVVDYVQVKYFAVFNFADACITGAVVVAVLLMLTGRAPSPAPQPEPADRAEPTAGDRR